jgi:hypothetical protein
VKRHYALVHSFALPTYYYFTYSLTMVQSTMLTSFLEMGGCNAMMTMALPGLGSGLGSGSGWGLG